MSKRRDHVAEDVYLPFYRRGTQLSNPAELTVEFIQRMLERIAGELSVNRFNWQNLPASLNDRFMEVCLYNHALVVVFEDRVTGKLLASRATPAQGYDMNMDPISYRLMPLQSGTLPSHLNGLTLSARNVVPIWANAFRTPDYDIVSFYSNRLAQTERTIDINLEGARATKFIAADENQRLSVENINRMIQNGDKVISVTRAQMASLKDVIAVLDMEIEPENIERLSIVRDRFWANLMTLLGINNSNQDKKERLVEAETGGNDDQIGNFRRINLNWRQKAAEQINKKWPDKLENGLISVDYHTDIDSDRPLFPDEDETETPGSEVVQNG